MNITLFSLSVSSMYSMSPFLVSHKRIIKHSIFENYFSTIIYNSESLQINNCAFKNGLGSVSIQDHNELKIKEEENYDHNNITYTSENCTGLYFQLSPKFAITFCDCLFTNLITMDRIISVQTPTSTFYMTDCIFNLCFSSYSLVHLSSKFISITHTCIYFSNDGYRMSATDYFVTANLDEPPSFIEIIFTTLTGNPTGKTNGNILYSYSRVQDCYSAKVNCVNASNLIDDNDGIRSPDSSLFKSSNSKCFTIKMNTFYNINQQYFICSERSENFFIPTCNFVSLNYEYGFYFYGSLSLEFENCRFLDVSNNFWSAEYQRSFLIQCVGCIFDKFEPKAKELITRDCEIDPNVTPNPLYHLNKGVCQANEFENAFGCRNGNCQNDFVIPPEYASFTIKFHTDIDSPPPTSSFTRSDAFTKSLDFTASSIPTSVFTDSSTFSTSSVFTETQFFTKSSIFTKSQTFTESSVFTNSNTFPPSSKFSLSVEFSMSESFLYTGSFLVVKDDSSAKMKKIGIIAAIAVGAVVVIAVVVVAVICVIRKKRINTSNAIEIEEEDHVDNPIYTVHGDLDPFQDEFVRPIEISAN